MKKNYWQLFFFAALITGCKKNKNESEAPAPLIAVISETGPGPNAATRNKEFTYDEQLRVKEINESGGTSPILRRRYSYVGNKVELRAYDVNGNQQSMYAVDYYLNSKGLVEEYRSDYNGLRYIYEYNDQNFLKKISHFRDGILNAYTYYSYSGNNVLDSISVNSPANEKGSVTVFSYDHSKRNTTGNANKGMKIFGRDQSFPSIKEAMFFYNLPGNIGRRLIYVDIDYTHSYINGERIVNSVQSRTSYSYPGPVVTNSIAGRFGYTYQ